MASERAEGIPVSFSQATKVEELDPHTYRVNFSDAFCIGTVPNGGYTASCMLAAAGEHLSSHDQPHTLAAHFEYPERTAAGPAIVVVEDIKLSRQRSTLHLTLWQDGLLSQAPWITPSVSRRVVLAYTTHTNLRTATGITLPTGYEGTPAATLPSLPHFQALKTAGTDEAWEESKLPSVFAHMRSLHNWRFYLPRRGRPLTPGVLDMWICMAKNGERITQRALPYVVDSFPSNLQEFLVAPELRGLVEVPQDDRVEAAAGTGEKEKPRGEAPRATLWLPTLAMNLEVKSALPEEGVEWLAVRVTSKQIKDGRFDLDVTVRDAEGDLVALSHHVAMIVSIERNTGKRESSMKAAL